MVADEGSKGASDSAMRDSFARRAGIDNIETVRPGDLVFRRQGGQVVVEVEYTRKSPLAGNVSLSFDFKASSQHSRK
jgi:ribosomal protein L27